jgi:hypothetical protein
MKKKNKQTKAQTFKNYRLFGGYYLFVTLNHLCKYHEKFTFNWENVTIPLYIYY